MSKKHWPSKWVFILAAIGSAAGIGNLWRFPALAFEHGGGSFLFAIIVANIVIGIPLLALEVGLGQYTQKAAPDAFGAIKKSLRFLGWSAVVFALMVLAYYMAVVAWSIDFFAAAFNLGWGNSPKDFFFNDVLQISSGPAEVGGISWPVFTGMLAAWVLVYFSVWKGVESISKVIKWTVILPLIILVGLIVRAITLPGSADGLALFFTPQWSALADSQLWLAAFSQVFFSLSVAFGAMIAYGSLRQKKDEIVQSVWWIAGGNFVVSLMSGIVVFGTLGYMAQAQGVGITEVFAGGPSLAFITFPTAINLLPGLNALVAVLFFLTFITLALDSAFSLLETLSIAIRDRFSEISTQKLTFGLAVIGVLLSIPFVTKAGLYYLDIIDHFIVSYGLIIIGILEALIVGWFWKGDKLKTFINEQSPNWKLGGFWSFSIKIIIPVFLTILLVLNIRAEFMTPYEGYPVWALIYIGLVPLLAAPLIGIVLDKLISKK